MSNELDGRAFPNAKKTANFYGVLIVEFDSVVIWQLFYAFRAADRQPGLRLQVVLHALMNFILYSAAGDG